MLEQMHCQVVQTDYERIDDVILESYANEVPTWDCVAVGSVPHLQKMFVFTHEHEVMMFTCELMALAKSEAHQPEIICLPDQVKVMWWTHNIAELHINDFIMAAKTDGIFEKIQKYSYLQ